MDPLYYRTPGPEFLADPDPNYAVFLDVLGRNTMRLPLPLCLGAENTPSWYFRGAAGDTRQDERTGPFYDGVGRLGWALFGKRAFVMTKAGLEFWDESNQLVGVITPAIPGIVSGAATTYANASTNTVLDLTGRRGRIEFHDSTDGWAVVRFNPTTITIESSSADWVASNTPATGEIGLAVAAGVLEMYVGATAARDIGWTTSKVDF